MEAVYSFGEWVRRRREAFTLTRVELAQCAGCSVSALRKIEGDERRPSRQLAGLLAGCLEIQPKARAAFVDAARGRRPVDRLGPPEAGTLAFSSTPASAGTPRPAAGNVPAQTTPTLGRETELAALTRLLHAPECRLLTIAGPGGIGKTRLALEVACLQWEQFAHGVFLASLAATSSPEFMVPAIARAVGLNFTGPTNPRSQLIHFLRDQQALLLLDNLEHLLEGIDLVVELLERAPGVKLLATSRERLGLQGEWVFEVQGLPVPDEGVTEPLETYSSVQLFLQRARQVQLDFALSAENGPDVARICRLVEGMPLALELAAAWVPVLSCREIAEEIERSIDFLTTTMRDIPERQRSLRAVFDHSWRLLDREEMGVLCKLSVFRGNFEREAAEIVAGATLTALSALVAKSFLHRNAAGRYSLHELVRQYVAGRLGEAPVAEMEARDGHSAYYADFVAGWAGDLKGLEQLSALAAIDAEIDNIRAGWRWAVERAQEAAIGKYLNSMMNFYEIRGWHEEAVRVCARVLAVLESSGSREGRRLSARTQAYQAGALQNLGQLEEAEKLLEASLAQARKLNASEDIAHARMRLGSGAIFGGAAHAALPHFEQALEIYEALDDHYGKVWALQGLGWATLNLDRVDLTQQYHQRSLPLLREHGPPNLLAWTLFEIGGMARERGDYEEARAYLEEAKGVCEVIGYRFALLSCLLGLGQTAEAVGQFGEAHGHYRQAVALRSHVGDVADIAVCLMLLTRVTLALGNSQEAEGYLQALFAFCTGSANPIARGCYEYAAGEVARVQGRLQAAETHFRQSVEMMRPTRRRAVALLALLSLGHLYQRLGDEARAEAHFREALQEAWQKSAMGPTLTAVCGIAAILLRREAWEPALELATLVQSHPATPWGARQQAEELLNGLTEVLADGRFAAVSQREGARPLAVVLAGLLTGVT